MQLELFDRGMVLGQSAGGRSTDVLHVSEIYGRLLETLYPKKYDRSRPMDMTRIETGLLFENVLEQGLKEKFATARVGEILSDEGIAMSPDGVNPTLGCGEEYKATWKSCRHGLLDNDGAPLPQFLGWFIQMKAYAKWLGVDTFLLTVLFINGDYTQPLAPQMKTWKLVFTQEEIDDNWTGLMAFAREQHMFCTHAKEAA